MHSNLSIYELLEKEYTIRMSYNVPTTISFIKQTVIEQRQRLYDVGTKIVFVKASDEAWTVPITI